MDVLVDESLELPPRGFRPRRRWLITVLDGLSWEGRTRVAGHLSGGKVTKKKKHYKSLIMTQILSSTFDYFSLSVLFHNFFKFTQLIYES